MKTPVTSILLATMLGMCAMAADASEKQPGWFRKTFFRLSWEETQAVAATPRTICAAVRHNVNYKEDLDDVWASGAETWNRGFGDCEDFAACVVDLCKAAGIEARTEVFFAEDSLEAHAVVIGSWKGKMWMSSNGWYQGIESLEEAKRAIAKDMSWRHKEILIASQEKARGVSVTL